MDNIFNCVTVHYFFDRYNIGVVNVDNILLPRSTISPQVVAYSSFLQIEG